MRYKVWEIPIPCYSGCSTAFFENGGNGMKGNAVGLLVVAGILMMLAGTLFVFLQMGRYTAMLLIGAFGCFAAALNFRNR